MKYSGVDVLVQGLDMAASRLSAAVQGLSAEQMVWRPKPTANSIAFYLWHVSRVTDLYIHQRIRNTDEIWEGGDWNGVIPLEVKGRGRGGWGVGMGYSDEQVGEMPALPAESYLAYWDAVYKSVRAWLQLLPSDSLARPVVFPGLALDTIGNTMLHSTAHVHLHRGEIWFLKGLMGLPGLG